MIIRKKYIRYTFMTIFLLTLIVSANITYRRIVSEQKSNKIELALSLKEIKNLAFLGSITPKKLLKKIKSENNITSIAVEEDTLEDYINEGRATLLKGSEVMNLYRVGHVNRYILTHLYKKVKVKPDCFYLFVDEKDDYERIKNFLTLEFGSKKVKQIGRWNILEVLDEKNDLLSIGLGISKSKVQILQKADFSVIVRLKNSSRLSDRLIRQKFRDISRLENINTIIFEGSDILGNPNKLAIVQEKIEEGNYQLGIIEFTKQKGINLLAKKLPTSVIRVHSIPEDRMETIAQGTAVKRYIRAAKERGVKILFLHPFYKNFGGENIVAFNTQYFNKINSGLNNFGFEIEAIESVAIKNFQPAQSWELFILSIGVFSMLLFLLNQFFSISTNKMIIFISIFAFTFYIFHLFDAISIWNRMLALITAIVFPTGAIISQFPKRKTTADFKKHLANSLLYMLKVSAITIVGALVIVSFLSNIEYLLSINLYFGVKISFITPLILIGLYFYLRPHRISSMYYVFKRLFYAPIRTASLLAVIFCSIFVTIYILRSGNYVSFKIPFLENYLREALESILFVRPRTKEFLIGYPLLLFAFVYTDRKIPRSWLWFFNTLGSVALISIINSFCHFHTPILISAIRTALGLSIGILVGIAYIFIYKLCLIIIKRLT
jgi:hypothetical protein